MSSNSQRVHLRFAIYLSANYEIPLSQNPSLSGWNYITFITPQRHIHLKIFPPRSTGRQTDSFDESPLNYKFRTLTSFILILRVRCCKESMKPKRGLIANHRHCVPFLVCPMPGLADGKSTRTSLNIVCFVTRNVVCRTTYRFTRAMCNGNVQHRVCNWLDVYCWVSLKVQVLSRG